MAYRSSSKSQSTSSPNVIHENKVTEDPYVLVAYNKTTQRNVTCVYQAHIGGYWRNVTITWSKNLMNNCLTISVESIETENQSSCKIDLKPWHFWAKRGFKKFEVDDNQLEAYWDLRSATFSGSSPEPCTNFYVALIWEEEVVLLLGDAKKKAYKKTKARPSLVEGVLFYKKEHVFGRKSFSTRARFDHENKEHDIVVESSTAGSGDPEMSVSIDGDVLIHIQNLQWKFRGNQTVQVNKQPVQVFWDVYSWLFCSPGSSNGLFIFKPGATDLDSDNDNDIDSDIEMEESNQDGDSDDGSGHSQYYSVRSHSKASKFCLFLYAWKIE